MPNFNIILSGFNLGGLNPPIVDNSDQQSDSEYLHGGSHDASLTTWMGTPVFSDFRFEKNGKVNDLWLETVLIDVSQTKNIVTTAITGRDGTIKEYISDGDYVINIKGVICSLNDKFPLSDVRTLLDILRLKETLKIVSDYLRIFNIYNIVITDYKFSQVEGFQNSQFFEINAISDTDEVIITKK